MSQRKVPKAADETYHPECLRNNSLLLLKDKEVERERENRLLVYLELVQRARERGKGSRIIALSGLSLLLAVPTAAQVASAVRITLRRHTCLLGGVRSQVSSCPPFQYYTGLLQ